MLFFVFPAITRHTVQSNVIAEVKVEEISHFKSFSRLKQKQKFLFSTS
jgi:hypothetical protein